VRYLGDQTVEGTNQEKIKGEPGSITPGLVIKATKNLGIGLSWTKWFGITKWSRTVPDWFPTMGSNRTDIRYNGSNFQINNYINWPLFRMSLIYYTPLTLMTATKLSHEFQGAYEIGVSSELSATLKIAVNFYYQDNSELRNWGEENNSDEKYTSGKELTIGIEYDKLGSKFLSPIFFLLKLYWLPLVEGSGDDHFGSRLEADEMPGYELVIGKSIAISKFTVLFSINYTEQVSKIWEYPILPPYS
jgi:hypothetical protein